MDITEFIEARLAEREAAAKGHLCVNCGIRIAPLRSPFGVTGYTHDGESIEVNGRLQWGWQGQRCPGTLLGADAIQNPEFALRELAAMRAIVAAFRHAPDWTGGQDVRHLAAIWSDHPAYDPAWVPENAVAS